MSGTLAPEVHDKAPTAVRLIGIDFTDELPPGILLTGTPTVTSDNPTAITIDNEAVNSVATRINGRTVAIGKAVICRASGGTEGDDHLLTATCGTTSSPAETLVGTCRLRIRK